MMSVDLNVLLQNTKGNYSQLCRKLPSLVHDKGVAYGRWSLWDSWLYPFFSAVDYDWSWSWNLTWQSWMYLSDVYLTNFLKSNLTKFAVIWVKKGQTAEFFSCPRSSKITPTKKKERRKRKSEEEERRRREKSNGCTLTFYNGYSGDSFWPIKTHGCLFTFPSIILVFFLTIFLGQEIYCWETCWTGRRGWSWFLSSPWP